MIDTLRLLTNWLYEGVRTQSAYPCVWGSTTRRVGLRVSQFVDPLVGARAWGRTLGYVTPFELRVRGLRVLTSYPYLVYSDPYLQECIGTVPTPVCAWPGQAESGLGGLSTLLVRLMRELFPESNSLDIRHHVAMATAPLEEELAFAAMPPALAPRTPA